MKKSVFIIAAILCLSGLGAWYYTVDQFIMAEELPIPVQAFVQKNFPGQGVSYAKVDRDLFGTTYELYLDNGVEMDINKNGKWAKVDGNYNPIPTSILPARIANYVNTHFTGDCVTKIDQSLLGYDVELSNELELNFNRNGMLRNVDD